MSGRWWAVNAVLAGLALMAWAVAWRSGGAVVLGMGGAVPIGGTLAVAVLRRWFR